jgi:hypothetical protein
MNINNKVAIILLLTSLCSVRVLAQSDTIKLSKAPNVDVDLRTEDRFPDDHGSIGAKVLWIRKLSDVSKWDSPVIFKSKILVPNSSKCYDLFSGKAMNLESDSSKQVFGESFIQVPTKGNLKTYSQGKLIGTYGGVRSELAAKKSKRGFGFGSYKVMCVNSSGDEIWSIKHPKRMASEVWLKDNFIVALEPFSFPFKDNDGQLIVLDYNGDIQAIVDGLGETPSLIIEKSGMLYVGGFVDFFALDIVKKKVIWRINKRIEQHFSLYKDKLVSASLVLDPRTGAVLEKYPMGVNGEWKLWNDHFVTRVFDGDEYNDFLCGDSPRKYLYLNYRGLRSYKPFETISLTGNYPLETVGDTTAAIFKGSDGFYLVGLQVDMSK